MPKRKSRLGRFAETIGSIRQYRAASAVGIFVLAVIGFAALHHLLTEVSLADIRGAVSELAPIQIAAAIGFTAISYAVLTFYDVLALQLIQRPLPWRTAAFASFVSYAVSNNLGLALLTGGTTRYRIYSAAGLSAADIARVVATATVTFWSGTTVLVGVALVIHPSALHVSSFTVPLAAQRGVGGIILLATLAMLAWLGRSGRSLRINSWTMPLPGWPLALAQIGVAVFDLAAASAALWVLLPDPAMVPWPALFLGYALAVVLAAASHVPGGIGVFEAVILMAVPAIDQSGMLAALLAYRAIYYLLPLLAAGLLVVIREGVNWRAIRHRGIFGAAHAVAGGVAPVLMSALTCAGGVVLLISGASPALTARLDTLRTFVPLPFVEASHIAASLVGTGLLLLAPALYRRLDAAFLLTRALLLSGALFSIAKGIDYEEALLLLFIAALLQWTRRSFYRQTALTTTAYSPAWLGTILLATALSFAIGVFANKTVAYENQLWWQFAWAGDASRFLRASFAVAVALTILLLLRLFRPAKVAESEADTSAASLAALAQAASPDANLALTGDKRFLVTPSGDAFIMYQVQGHTWIVMGDPVGPPALWPELLWQIRERADLAQGRLLLYQVSADVLPIAIDLGLQLVKYGEEALVDLSKFTLDGPAAKDLRYADRRATREGAQFDLVAAEDVPTLIDELRAISDQWINAKGRSEKAFSVGRFDPTYLAKFDCAVVRHAGRIVAFANVWKTPHRDCLSVDLMRHSSDMPYGTMDFLFVRLMQWGKLNEYRWFSLGLAPLSGLEARRLAPIWARAGDFLYRHGEAFYGFEGLRAYKQKFSPLWVPRYIAGPSNVGLGRGLIDLQTLIAGRANSAARRSRSQLAS
jgi:phosphatidylglycerol lysyltransferase